MFNRIKTAISVLFSGDAHKRLKASYDNAQTTDENREHWANADDKPAPIANSKHVRYKLRSRARYEEENNSYCSGLVSTLATDLIGYTLPKLRVIDSDTRIKSMIETEWQRWCDNPLVNLSSKLRILDETRTVEGEGFLLPSQDDEVFSQTGFNLGVSVLGAARVSDPYDWNIGTYTEDVFDIDGQYLKTVKLYNDDGVVVDVMTGRPHSYKIVPPGDDLYYVGGSGFDPIKLPSRYLLQWFNPRRAGQYRGISELRTTLGLYAQLRRFDLATLSAAEVAAMLAGIMQTNAPPGEEPAEVRPFSEFRLQRGMLLTLPEGWSASQFKAEHPMQVYDMFVDKILRQIGRALDVPFGIVAGDSSKYNYSSAQLDYRGYEERLKFIRNQLSIRILNPLFHEWLLELANMNPQIGRIFHTRSIYHSWSYAQRPSSDPQKDAGAEDMRLKNGTTTLATVYADRGEDWEEALEQRRKEFDRIKQLNLDPATLMPTGATSTIEPTSTL